MLNPRPKNIPHSSPSVTRYSLHVNPKPQRCSTPHRPKTKPKVHSQLTQIHPLHHESSQTQTPNSSSISRSEKRLYCLYPSHPSQSVRSKDEKLSSHDRKPIASSLVSRLHHLFQLRLQSTKRFFPLFPVVARSSTPQATFPEDPPAFRNYTTQKKNQNSRFHSFQSPFHINTCASTSQDDARKKKTPLYLSLPPIQTLANLRYSEKPRGEDGKKKEREGPQMSSTYMKVRKKQRASSTTRREIIREKKVKPKIPVGKESLGPHLPHIPSPFLLSAFHTVDRLFRVHNPSLRSLP